jgi:hypothetical protein
LEKFYADGTQCERVIMATYFEKLVRLSGLVDVAESRYKTAQVNAKSSGTTTPVRHKCFICYHGADIDAVTNFVESYEDVFIPRVVGVTDSDHFGDPINSKDEEYIKSQIAQKYFWDSTVTILYVGKCTWSRKYVDWELSSSLRNDTNNKRNGLLAITPQDNNHNTTPSRLQDNYRKDNLAQSYARYNYYPTSESELRGYIQDAFDARDARASFIKNTRALMRANSVC